jgi:PAS domain S-box-containing protein
MDYLNRNVVLIEDTRSFTTYIVALLESYNYTVKTFSQGQEAMDYLKNPEIVPDVIITDNFLPDMEGIDIIKYFTENKYDYAFIIVTSSSSLDLAVKGMKLGALDYITKTKDIKEVLEVVVDKTIKQNRQKIERKNLEQRLAVSEEKFRSLAESSDDIIMRFDKDFRHLYANPITTNFFGIDYKKFIGKTHLELGFKKAEFEFWEEKISEVFESGKSTRQIIPFDNEKMWFDWSLIPEFNEKHEVVSVLSYSRDITGLKNAQKALKESEQKFIELNRTKDKLFSIIGHDLRGPIGNFKALIELVLTDFDVSDLEQIKEILQATEESAGRIYELLENLLSWAKSQQHEIVFNPEEVNVSELSSAIISLLSETSRQKNITIHNKVTKSLFVKADYNMISTIIRNLTTNAIKFTPKNKNIYLTTEIENDRVTISIKDEGVGIDEKNLKKLFNAAEDYKTPGTSGERGSGLGLLLCKDFVEKHGGTIWVESKVGKGSEFKFTINKA